MAEDTLLELMKYAGSALGGGALLKAIEFMANRRKTRAEADSTLSQEAVNFVSTLLEEMKTIKDETAQCHDNYERVMQDCVDLKIKLKGMHSYMGEHLKKCQPDMEIPSLDSFKV